MELPFAFFCAIIAGLFLMGAVLYLLSFTLGGHGIVVMSITLLASAIMSMIAILVGTATPYPNASVTVLLLPGIPFIFAVSSVMFGYDRVRALLRRYDLLYRGKSVDAEV